MSVYKRKGAKTYSYDFQYKGARFSGDTGETSRREAERVEAAERDRAIRDFLSQRRQPVAAMRFDQAVARYWEEVGQTHKNAATTLTVLEWLQREVGPTTTLREIDDNLVAGLVTKRRREGRSVAAKSNRPLAPATINRTVIQPLRRLLRRAALVWKVPVGDVKWGLHLLKEPKERVREASLGEEASIRLQLRNGYDVMVDFAFHSGCRRMEMLGLTWDSVDFAGERFVVTGKNGKSRTLPITPYLRQLFEQCTGHHPHQVFTYVAARTDKRKGLVKGQRYPITEEGMKTAFRRALSKTGVSNFRFHDTRHTMATRTLRHSNIRVVQQLLGHEDVATTAKYAHAVVDDVAAAMNAASPTKSPTNTLKEGAKVLTLKEKIG